MDTTSKDARLWAMLSHLTAFSGFFIPLGNIIAPLIIWLIKKDQHEFVDDQGKESLNFQISITLYAIISVVLAFVLIGFILIAAILIFEFIVVIIATVKSNDGHVYRYPLTIRFIK